MTTHPAQSQHGVYEIKFLLTEVQGLAVREWARNHLQPDPHSTAADGHGYDVNSLYLDTPGFDVYRREDGFRQRKYRVRRYGSESAIWLEVKQKIDGQVTKRRVTIPDHELSHHLFGDSTDEWEGRWFQQRIQTLRLQPVCRVTYRRFACVGNSLTGPTRLTIDRDLSCQIADGWQVPDRPLEVSDLLNGQQILELKFRDSLPGSFRGLIADLGLIPGSFSKYRQSVEACVPIPRLIDDVAA